MVLDMTFPTYNIRDIPQASTALHYDYDFMTALIKADHASTVI